MSWRRCDGDDRPVIPPGRRFSENVLLWWDGDVVIGHAKGTWAGGPAWRTDHVRNSDAPTHWMPLPDPPS